MSRIREVFGVAFALTACAGPHAGAQPSPLAAGIRPDLYQVTPEQLAQARETPFIEVSGSGEVEVAPDRAAVSFAVETRADAAAAAAAANAQAMDRVLRAVRGASLPGLDVSTYGYSLRPEYSTGNTRNREIVAYVALNNVRATSSDVDAVGRLIDVAIGAGANRVASIAFMASDTEEARREALSRAVESARLQAEVIARSLGRALGPPLEVHGGAQAPVPIMARAGMAMELQAMPTPIEAGDQTVSASVTIRFALGPELGG